MSPAEAQQLSEDWNEDLEVTTVAIIKNTYCLVKLRSGRIFFTFFTLRVSV